MFGLPTDQSFTFQILHILNLLTCGLQLLCLIGESFDEASEDVCGAVVNVRPKGDKISIWTGNCQNKEAITTIGYVTMLLIKNKTSKCINMSEELY